MDIFSKNYDHLDKESLIGELKKYQTILELNELITKDLDLEIVLHNVLHEAIELTSSEKASIFLINREKNILEFAATTDENAGDLKNLTVPLGKGIAGYVAETGKFVNMENVKKDERFYSGIDKATGQDTTSYLCVPLMVRNRIIGTAQLMNKKDGVYQQNDEYIMMEFARIAAIAIENALLHKITLEKERIERDLTVAREIQNNLLPDRFPELPDYSIWGLTRPAQQVGGDYYNYFLSERKDDYIDIVISDVSGKGISASLIVENFDASLKLYKSMYEDVELLMYYVNNFICDNIILGKFITVFFARIHRKTGIVQYINAGHNSPYMFKAQDGNSEVIELENSGPFMGLMKDFAYRSFYLKLEDNETLLAFSDGIVEAMNEKEELYSEERLINDYKEIEKKLKKEKRVLDARRIVEYIQDKVTSFQNSAAQHDDLTLLVVTNNGKKPEK